MRTASHQDMSIAARKRPRPERNGMVESETIVPQTPATSTVAGKKSNKTLPTICQKESPESTVRNTSACQSTIHDRPPQIQPHTVWRIQLHCSVCAVPSGCCMSILPHWGWGPGLTVVGTDRSRTPERPGHIDSDHLRPVKRLR